LVCEEGAQLMSSDETPLASSNAMELEFGKQPPRQARVSKSRVERPSYYGILDMQDVEMRTSYMIRETESLRAQLSEDEQVEQYWSTRLQALPKDLR